jgi:calcineurin-like phosphoesterase family protein
MIYFTSDLHLGHKNIIKYCNRPFLNVEEMNETIINNWNNKITNEDIVYNIGDFCFGDASYFLSKLNGNKHLLLGDHDKQINNGLKKLAYIHKEKIIEIPIEVNNKKQLIILCHWCMRTWPKSHYNSWHLFGHSHGRLNSIGKSHDVGIDNNNFNPLSLIDIIEIMNNKEDNPNLIKNKIY